MIREGKKRYFILKCYKNINKMHPSKIIKNPIIHLEALFTRHKLLIPRQNLYTQENVGFKLPRKYTKSSYKNRHLKIILFESFFLNAVCSYKNIL